MSDLDPRLADDLVDALRGWYFTHRRRLPWRDEPTPYRVWVSEIMLQQTQVATVLPYFERFLATFPDVASLAAASDEALLATWSGLGYYRRAKNLHRAAKVVMDEHGGALPDTVAGLLTLPGIGRYTAGAIASIAFGRRAPLLDGNVARVFSRVFAMTEAADSSAGQKHLWALAEALVPADASSHNQALMELGALVCSPKKPACPTCPLSDRCRANALGTPEAFPVMAKKTAVKAVHAVAGLVRKDAGSDQVLLGKRPADGLLADLWELPGTELATPRSPRKAALAKALRERAGIDVEVGELIATVEHQFTHRHLSLEIFATALRDRTRATPTPPSFYQALSWFAASPTAPNDASLALSTLTRKVLAAVNSRHEASPSPPRPSSTASRLRPRGDELAGQRGRRTSQRAQR